MKKTIIKIGLAAAMITGAAIGINYSINTNSQDAHIALVTQLEALAEGEGGYELICRCSRITDQSCAVNNKSSVCATGHNIHCSNWNSNCHKNI